jgi:CRP/FNR family transcriptional regulator, cyclic AMP receptor protein
MRRARLLDVDPDLARRLKPETAERARRSIIVEVERLDPGPWTLDRSEPEGAHFGLMIIDGLAIRELAVAGSRSLELLNNGDILRPWQEDSASFCEARWQRLTPVTVASLGPPAAHAICRWPPLVAALLERALHRSRSLAVQAAIESTVGLENRLLLPFWHAAERWGTRTDDGVELPLELTHEMIGLLVGARRPSVSAALNALARDGRLVREDGTWTLRGEAPASAVPAVELG